MNFGSPFLFPGKPLKLVLPACLEDLLTESEVKSVFRHEASHASTRDPCWLSVARFLNSIFWFHPLFRWIVLEHIIACEEAADAAAARIGNASQYKKALARAALELQPVTAGVPTLLRRSRVLNRLRKIEINSALRPPSRRAALSSLSLLLAVCLLSGNISLGQKGEQTPQAEPVVEIPSEIPVEPSITAEEQEKVKKADELALRSKQLVEQGLLEEALGKLTHSLDALPFSPLTASRRSSYVDRLNRIKVLLKEEAAPSPRDTPIQGSFDPEILKTLIIPEVNFESIPLQEALKKLETISSEIDPKGVGAPIQLMVDADQSEALITLKLSRVPLAEAIRFTTSLARLNYRVTQEGVIVLDVNDPSSTNNLITNAYHVSEDFFPRGVDAKKFLETIGIQFDTGASALFKSDDSTIIMRNLEGENDKLELFLKIISSSSDPNDLYYQTFLLTKEAREFEKNGETQKALEKFFSVFSLYQYLTIRFPDFHKALIENKTQVSKEKLIALQFGISPRELPKKGDLGTPRLWTDQDNLSRLTSSPTPPELADSLLKISGVTVNRTNDKKNAEIQVEIVSGYPSKVSAEEMSLEVRIFDLHNGKELASGKGNITMEYPTTPYDWKAEENEQIQISYEISSDDPTAVNRVYYGYVIELYHKEILQYVVASPSKLVRLTQ